MEHSARRVQHKELSGFTITLDKRLAADGRGLIKEEVNDRHAQMAEALFIAERKAREEVNMRNKLKARQAEEERIREEEKLAKLAADARAQRAGAIAADAENPGDAAAGGGSDVAEGGALGWGNASRCKRVASARGNAARAASRARPHFAYGRSRQCGEPQERRREGHLGEKLGWAWRGASRKAEVQYDERLFNQTGGIGSGLLQDGEAAVYEQGPLSKRTDVLSLPPSRAALDSYGGQSAEQAYEELQSKAKRFRADKEFVGETSDRQNGAPVKFEKSSAVSSIRAVSFAGSVWINVGGIFCGRRRRLCPVWGGHRGGSMLAAAGASSKDQLMNSRAGASGSLDARFQSSSR